MCVERRCGQIGTTYVLRLLLTYGHSVAPGPGAHHRGGWQRFGVLFWPETCCKPHGTQGSGRDICLLYIMVVVLSPHLQIASTQELFCGVLLCSSVVCQAFAGCCSPGGCCRAGAALCSLLLTCKRSGRFRVDVHLQGCNQQCVATAAGLQPATCGRERSLWLNTLAVHPLHRQQQGSCMRLCTAANWRRANFREGRTSYIVVSGRLCGCLSEA